MSQVKEQPNLVGPPAALSFGLFCLLLALRDSVSHLFLARSEGTVHPVFMLFVYCTAASVYAWVFRILRTRSFVFLGRFQELSSRQRWTFIKLGFATWIVYVVTIYGIRALGASVFNVVDYGGMPILTILAGVILLKDRPSWNQILGGIVGLIGLSMFFLAPQNITLPDEWRLWLFIALFSPVFTSLCSAYQKEQVDDGMHPDEVLLYRFPIPAALMFCWLLVERPPMPWATVPGLLAVSFFGLFLPLVLLCFGLMRATLSRFAAYLFLIPILTFVFGPLLVEGEWAKLLNPLVSAGIIMVLAGYAVSELLQSAKS